LEKSYDPLISFLTMLLCFISSNSIANSLPVAKEQARSHLVESAVKL
jgi:hypothetical protein